MKLFQKDWRAYIMLLNHVFGFNLPITATYVNHLIAVVSSMLSGVGWNII